MKTINIWLLFAFIAGTLFQNNVYAQFDSINIIEYLLPMEPQAPLVSEGIWGDPTNALPRDTANGLEDADISDWVYWDGSIVKDDEGRYHMYASKWDQGFQHSAGWRNHSKAMHAVSNSWYGPFIDQGFTWPYWQEGKAHNTMGLRMHDGRYAMVTSEITPGNIFVSDSPDGPFEYLGRIKIDYNGFHPGMAHYGYEPYHMSNVMVFARPDGRYMIIARQCTPLLSDNGILGPYKIMDNGVYSGYPELPQEKMEDPTVWYTDGLYHVVVAHHPKAKGYHFTSRNGINNWKYRGISSDGRDGDMFEYTDGTLNTWGDVQRPTVYVEDGLIKAFHFSVLDLGKGEDLGDDNHGSKIVVIPFNGEAFSEDMREIIRKEDSIVDATPIPVPWLSEDIGDYTTEGAANYNNEFGIFKTRSTGMNINDTSDNFRYTYQQVTGDFMITAQIFTQDETHPWAKAGVMIRKSLDANAMNASVLLTPYNGALFQYRTDTAAQTDSVINEQIMPPYWIRLVKNNNSITGYISSGNKLNWDTLGSATIDMGSDSYYIGLASNSNNADSINISRIQHVNVSEINAVDMITSNNLPQIIPPSQSFTIEVGYATSQSRNIFVQLQEADGPVVYSHTETVNGLGTSRFSFTPTSTLTTDAEYRWDIDLKETGGSIIDGSSIFLKAWLGVPDVAVDSFQISSSELTIDINETLFLTNTYYPSNASDTDYHWYSDNDNVAMIDWVTGKLVGLAQGTANIIVQSEYYDVADTCEVTVTNVYAPEVVVTFESPEANATFESPANVYVKANATTSASGIVNVKLYLNSSFVRQESLAPYEWNGTGQNDPSLRSMSAGEYTLRAVATDSNGKTGEKSINITVTGGTDPDPNPDPDPETSLNGFNNEEALVFPNPFKDELTIINNNNRFNQVLIEDMSGRMVLNESIHNKNQLVINSDQLNGKNAIYFLKLIGSASTMIYKVININ